MRVTDKLTFKGINKDLALDKRDNSLYWHAENLMLLNEGDNGNLSTHHKHKMRFEFHSIHKSEWLSSPDQTRGWSLNYSLYDIDGNESVITTPVVWGDNGGDSSHYLGGDYTTMKIIGQKSIMNPGFDDSTVVFINGTNSSGSVTMIIVIDFNDDITIKFVNNLGLSNDTKLDIITNVEGSDNKNVYWADGSNQLRKLNISGDESLLTPPEGIDQNPASNMLPPRIIDVNETGNFGSGSVVYAYTYMNDNGIQTKLSPISHSIDIHRGFGLDNNENHCGHDLHSIPIEYNKSVTIQIPNINSNFSKLSLYRLYWSSSNGDPDVRIIQNEVYINGGTFEYTDAGQTDLETIITLSELIDLGSSAYSPSHIEIKKNRLFAANFNTLALKIPESFDTRAFSYKKSQISTSVVDSNGSNPVFFNPSIDGYPNLDFDSVNPSLFTAESSGSGSGNFYKPVKFDGSVGDTLEYSYMRNSIKFGGSGELVNFELKYNHYANALVDKRTFKEGNTYRFAIRFFTNAGNATNPSWISDYTIPYLYNGDYQNDNAERTITIDFSLTAAGLIAAENKGYFSYEILMVNAEQNNRRVVSQGFIQPPVSRVRSPYDGGYDKYEFEYKLRPFNIGRAIKPYDYVDDGTNSDYETSQALDITGVSGPASTTDNSNTIFNYPVNEVSQFYSPYTEFLESNGYILNASNKIKPYGLAYCSSTFGADWDSLGPGNGRTRTYINFAYESTYTGGATGGVSYTKFAQSKSNGAVKIPNVSDDGYMPIDITQIKSVFSLKNSDTQTSLQIGQYSYNNFSEGESFSGGGSDDPYNPYGRYSLTDEGLDVSTSTHNWFTGANTVLIEYEDAQWSSFTGSVNEHESMSEVLITDFNPPASYETSNSPCSLDANIASYGGAVYDKFYETYPRSHNHDYFFLPLIEIINEGGPNIYDNNTINNRALSEYIMCGNAVELSDQTTAYGDNYRVRFDVAQISNHPSRVSYDGMGASDYYSRSDFSIYVDSTINTYGRHDATLDKMVNVAGRPSSQFYWNTVVELDYDAFMFGSDECQMSIHDVFATLESIPIYGIPLNFNEETSFCTRIIASEEKLPFESIDSWMRFESSTVKDLESKFGCITELYKFNDELFAFQKTGIAQLVISPIAQTAVNMDGAEDNILLGEGKVLHDAKYLTHNSGSSGKWCIADDGKKMLYYDKLNGTINMIQGTKNSMGDIEYELSKSTGLHDYIDDFTSLNYDSILSDPLKGEGYVVLGYNTFTNNIYATMVGSEESFTVSFNGLSNTFISFHDFKPNGFLRNSSKYDLYYNNVIERLYEVPDDIGSFGDAPVSLTLLHSRKEDVIKRYDNIEFSPIVYNDFDVNKSFTTWECYNSYQNTGVQDFDPSLRIRKHRSIVYRNEGTFDRMRDSHMFIKLDYNGLLNKVVIHDIYLHFNTVTPLRNGQ